MVTTMECSVREIFKKKNVVATNRTDHHCWPYFNYGKPFKHKTITAKRRF